MRIAGIKYNDIVDCESGICVSLWTQGCPHRCKGCHNPETWDFNGGYEIDEQKLIDIILRAINKNGVSRSFSILGGEPLCEENLSAVERILAKVKKTYPNCLIYIWTGYTLEFLQAKEDERINKIIKNTDYLIDGPYIESLRDIRLPLRGSSNQRIHKFF